MKKIICFIIIITTGISLATGQTNTGTLKIFSEIEGITVFVDEIAQPNYQDIQNLPAGTHYVRVMNGEKRIYGQIVTIVKDQVTTILIEKSQAAETKQTDNPSPVQKPAEPGIQQAERTGTLNIFSELTGVSVYLNDKKQGEDIRTISAVPVGDHYLKVIKDGVSIYGEIVTIKEGQTTTVLIKNDGQVAEKVMEGKVKEREQYNNSKIDILFTSKSITQTQGSSNLFPGYYGYWGYSNSVSSTSEISDFKIVKGGVQEISDLSLAQLANNKAILEQNASHNLRIKKMTNVGAPLLLIGTLTSLVYLGDFLLDKPFLHKNNPTHPDYEVYVATGAILSGVIGYGILSGVDKVIPRHYYSVQNAAKDAQEYNRALKKKLGLPEGYDVK